MVEAFREGQPPEIPRKTEGKLPESKIFDLLSSVGNAENKALELIVMREGVIYSRSVLWREVMNHQENIGWRMSRGLPFKHCQDSLDPVGLVTRESLSPDGSTWGYQITQYGLRTGIPFAGILLKWSYDHPDYSLYKMFSSTQSSSIKNEQSLEKKRAQETRYKIFWETATNPSNALRTTDLAQVIEENHQIAIYHLRSLNKNGVISYETIEKGRSVAYFNLKADAPTSVLTLYSIDKLLAERVYNLVRQRSIERLSSEGIANTLIQQFPEYEDLNRRGLNRRISRILSDSEKQGHVEREKFDVTFKSETTLSDKQRETIVSLVNLIDKFNNGDKETIEEGGRFAQRVANDPRLFSELMLKAKEASPSANRVDREEMSSILLSVLKEYPNSTVNKILQIIEENYESRLSYKGLVANLCRLLKENEPRIVSEKTKSGNVYRIVETENNLDVHLGGVSLDFARCQTVPGFARDKLATSEGYFS